MFQKRSLLEQLKNDLFSVAKKTPFKTQTVVEDFWPVL